MDCPIAYAYLTGFLSGWITVHAVEVVSRSQSVSEWTLEIPCSISRKSASKGGFQSSWIIKILIHDYKNFEFWFQHDIPSQHILLEAEACLPLDAWSCLKISICIQ